jgi:hypothetical protein
VDYWYQLVPAYVYGDNYDKNMPSDIWWVPFDFDTYKGSVDPDYKEMVEALECLDALAWTDFSKPDGIDSDFDQPYVDWFLEDDQSEDETGHDTQSHVGIPGFFEAKFGEVTGLEPTSKAVFKKCIEGDEPIYKYF